MTGAEALQAYKDGKKIRVTTWLPQHYLSNPDGEPSYSESKHTFYDFFYCNESTTSDGIVELIDTLLQELIHDDWEVVE